MVMAVLQNQSSTCSIYKTIVYVEHKSVSNIASAIRVVDVSCDFSLDDVVRGIRVLSLDNIYFLERGDTQPYGFDAPHTKSHGFVVGA